MLTHLLGAALLAVSAQASPPAVSAQNASLSQESKALLRCSAAFAVVSHGQSISNEAALKWPPLDTRGREFFVRALAQLMDETGLDRAGISQLVSAEAQRLWDDGEIEAVMPACLVMLDASGV
ncbi:hypothetical protein [Erythrobacter rubeus]|uniref:Lytic murein transglycosylase n=1 Tax=Erythrobacter rubeus TaxID=2760803 RepID=A0ABR8KTD3_9SPHN|nr:hypothetical protein [Erythrobacter rubeus]MBD2842865.1 hypothetical protein [Erythrobacter rubeus]